MSDTNALTLEPHQDNAFNALLNLLRNDNRVWFKHPAWKHKFAALNYLMLAMQEVKLMNSGIREAERGGIHSE